jgi:hypothetical protein
MDHGEQQVNAVFKHLLDRLAARKTPPRKAGNSSALGKQNQ